MPRRRRQRKTPSVTQSNKFKSIKLSLFKVQHEGGMEWDDGGMNITVNPLDDVEKQEQTTYSEEEEEDSSDDDGER